MKKYLLALTLLAAASTTAFAQWGRPVDYAEGPGLKDAYKDYFTIGVAVNKTNVSDPAQIEIIKKQFNSVTAENAWKPGEIHPKEGVWNFGLADSIANFCRENGTKPFTFEGKHIAVKKESNGKSFLVQEVRKNCNTDSQS